MADKDVPGVIAPPPLIFLSFLLAGIAADYVLGLSLSAWGLPRSASFFAGAVSVAMGVATMVVAIAGFSRAHTPVPTRSTTTALVTSGAHGLSRNPIYIGLFLNYAGLALLANSASAIVLLAPLAVVMRYGVVAREEAYLARKFGDAYSAYMARVPRWL
jgi:protein-S-isoprenylcysteine O-methyltransferase Ste14